MRLTACCTFVLLSTADVVVTADLELIKVGDAPIKRLLRSDTAAADDGAERSSLNVDLLRDLKPARELDFAALKVNAAPLKNSKASNSQRLKAIEKGFDPSWSSMSVDQLDHNDNFASWFLKLLLYRNEFQDGKAMALKRLRGAFKGEQLQAEDEQLQAKLMDAHLQGKLTDTQLQEKLEVVKLQAKLKDDDIILNIADKFMQKSDRWTLLSAPIKKDIFGTWAEDGIKTTKIRAALNDKWVKEYDNEVEKMVNKIEGKDTTDPTILGHNARTISKLKELLS